MAGRKKNKAQVLDVKAVREAGMLLMAYLHPLCELRAITGGEQSCELVPSDPTSYLLAVAAEQAAEAVVPNNATVLDAFGWVERFGLCLDLAASILGNPVGHADSKQALQNVGLVELAAAAIAQLFRRDRYRAALTALARLLDTDAVRTLDEITATILPSLPDPNQIKTDVGSLYIRLGWVAD